MRPASTPFIVRPLIANARHYYSEHIKAGISSTGDAAHGKGKRTKQWTKQRAGKRTGKRPGEVRPAPRYCRSLISPTILKVFGSKKASLRCPFSSKP